MLTEEWAEGKLVEQFKLVIDRKGLSTVVPPQVGGPRFFKKMRLSNEEQLANK